MMRMRAIRIVLNSVAPREEAEAVLDALGVPPADIATARRRNAIQQLRSIRAAIATRQTAEGITDAELNEADPDA